jgi:thiol-disulfide isomerase/thioredoxin
MMQRDTIITLGVLGAFLGVTGIAVVTIPDTPETPTETTDTEVVTIDVLNTSFRDLADNPVALIALDGAVFVVASWASWCPECTEQLRTLDTVATDFADQPIAFVSMNRAEPLRTINLYLDSQVPEVREGNVLHLQDADDTWFAGTDGRTAPELRIIDRTGTVLYRQAGPVSPDLLRRAIAAHAPPATAE